MNWARTAESGLVGISGSWAWSRLVTGRGLTILLASLFLLIVALPIQRANWVPGLPPLTLVALIGFALGTTFGMRGWTAGRAVSVALLSGALFVAVAVIGVAGPGGPLQRTANVVNDLQLWLAALATGGVHRGVLEFGIFILALFWGFGYATGWMAIRRRQAWGSVLVGGLILGVALGSLDEATTVFLVLYMASSVMLLIHLVSVRRLEQWRSQRVAFDPVIALSHSVAVLTFGLVVTVAVGILPTPDWAPLRNYTGAIESRVHEAEALFSRMFNGLPSRRTYRTLAYSEETFLRGNPNLTDDLLFTVSGSGGRQYWRARTYTTYTGQGWTAPEADFALFESDALQSSESRVEREYQFRIEAATDTLFNVGEPVRFDQDVEVLVDPDQPWDVLQARFTEGREFFPTRLKLQYSSSGSVSQASASQLREASSDLPIWIGDTYLQLPDTLPQRVRQLAFEVALGGANTYDRAEAIRRFLITYPYNLDVLPPPQDSDGVDYFLFHSQTGYCDYYATSMVVMLRAIGIPARYVLGYAPGSFNSARGVYEVLDLNYHSWPEVYFPGFGWVPFEPTPANAIEFGGTGVTDLTTLPAFPEGALGELPPEDELEEEGTFTGFDPVGGSSQALIVIGIAAVSMAILLLFAWYQWWWRLSLLDRSDELYTKMLRLAKILGVGHRPEQTPREYAAVLSGHMPEYASAIRRIVTAYERGRYGNERFAPLTEIKAADEAWRQIRWAWIKLALRPRSLPEAQPTRA